MKTRIVFIPIILIFLGCQNHSEKLSGLWISNNGYDVVLFRNDTLFSSERFPRFFAVRDSYILTDNERNKFFFEGEKLIVDWNERDLTKYSKSKFDNLFDHKTDKLGFKLNLQKGFSNTPLSNKANYSFIYIFNSKDSSIRINIEDEPVKIFEFPAKFKALSSRSSMPPSWVISVDKNILWKDFLEIIEPISHPEFGIRFEHTIRNKPECIFGCLPWESVSFEKIRNHPLNKDHLGAIEANTTFFNLKLEHSENIAINENSVSKAALFDSLKSIYSENSEHTSFNLIDSEQLTYGDFIWLFSMVKKIVSEKRDNFSKENYDMKWEEMKYSGSDLFKDENQRDSIHRDIRKNFPLIFLVDDMKMY